MKIKKLKPITPGQRHRKIIESIKNEGFEPLIKGKVSAGFRNNTGRITIRHRGGGHKRRYRNVDLNYLNGKNTQYEILRIDYDPNRTGLLALCRTKLALNNNNLRKNKDLDGSGIWIDGHKYFYKLAQIGDKAGEIRNNLENKLDNISIGSVISTIEIKSGQGAKLCRSAGTYATLLGKTEKGAIIKLPSEEIKTISKNCWATLGRISNEKHNLISLGKAGVSRWLGRRPIVRGEAMNPIDHPHGGKTRGGRPLKNIWGKLAKWVPLKRKI